VTKRRTSRDFAREEKDLPDVRYPEADTMVLVPDNLGIQTPAALYDVFAPAEARRLRERPEWHDTPKYGSWLDVAEIEWSVQTGRPDRREIVTTASRGSEQRVASRPAGPTRVVISFGSTFVREATD
jgi:hypothetical protein